jgi:hypothetical protein
VDQSTALRALTSLKQEREEEISAYIRRFDLMCTRFVGTLLNDDTLKQFFIQGFFKADTIKDILERNPKTLAAAKVAAREMDACIFHAYTWLVFQPAELQAYSLLTKPSYVCIWNCRAPLQNGCPKHHGHKGDPGVTPGTCGAGGEKAQVILMRVRTPGVGNTSHPRRLGVMRVGP